MDISTALLWANNAEPEIFFGLLYDPKLASEIIKLDHLEVLCMAV